MRTIATKVNNDVFDHLASECSRRGITMSVKLRELIDIEQNEMDDDIIDLMKLQIAQTVHTGREHGFSMCGNEKVRIADVGENNHIQLKRCPGLTVLFHTHPCGTPHPSEQDYRAVEGIESLQETCIGTRNAIRCFDPQTREITRKITL